MIKEPMRTRLSTTYQKFGRVCRSIPEHPPWNAPLSNCQPRFCHFQRRGSEVDAQDAAQVGSG